MSSIENPTPGERWKQGVDHDPRSEEIIRALSDLDWQFYNGVFDIKVGGDGDDGENMMYLLDYWFANKDIKQCESAEGHSNE